VDDSSCPQVLANGQELEGHPYDLIVVQCAGNVHTSKLLYNKAKEYEKWALEAREAANQTAYIGFNRWITNRNKVLASRLCSPSV
jgi:hypothetical protein